MGLLLTSWLQLFQGSMVKDSSQRVSVELIDEETGRRAATFGIPFRE